MWNWFSYTLTQSDLGLLVVVSILLPRQNARI